jgi:hypothetical protein
MLEAVAATGQVVLYCMTFEPGNENQLWMVTI